MKRKYRKYMPLLVMICCALLLSSGKAKIKILGGKDVYVPTLERNTKDLQIAGKLDVVGETKLNGDVTTDNAAINVTSDVNFTGILTGIGIPVGWKDITAQLSSSLPAPSWDYALASCFENSLGQKILKVQIKVTSGSLTDGVHTIDLAGLEPVYNDSGIHLQEKGSTTLESYILKDPIVMNPTPFFTIAEGLTSYPSDTWSLQPIPNTNSMFAEPFTLVAPKSVSGVDIRLYKTSGAGYFVADIVDALPTDGEGGPVGNAGWLSTHQFALSDAVNFNAVLGSFNYNNFAFSSLPTIPTGTYYLRIYAPQSSGYGGGMYIAKITDGGDDLSYWSISLPGWAASASDITIKLYEGALVPDTLRFKWNTSGQGTEFILTTGEIIVDRIPTWF